MVAPKLMFFGIALFLAALLSIGAALRDYFAIDLFMARAAQRMSAGPWNETMEIVSFIGRTPHLVALVLAAIVWLAWTKKKAEWFAVGAVLPTFGISLMLKTLIARPRPTDELVSVWRNHDSMSFPSGHAFNAMVVFGLVFYLVPFLCPWKAAVHAIRVLSMSLILIIGISRVYLGAHWPSDVAGGFLFGAVVLTLLIFLHRMLRSQAGLRLAA